MEELIVGDVVVVLFLFTNLTREKRRPVLVPAAVPDGDYVFCQITSHAWPESVTK